MSHLGLSENDAKLTHKIACFNRENNETIKSEGTLLSE